MSWTVTPAVNDLTLSAWSKSTSVQRHLISSLYRQDDDGEYHLVWYAVGLIALLALGATVLLGAIAYCTIKGQAFGGLRKNSFWSYSVGCHPW